MLKQIQKSINEHELLREGDRVLVALSGGPDSVALLEVLASLKKKLSLELSAIYVNHQIRPRAAVKEEKFCRRLCEKLNVEFMSFTHDVPGKARGEGLTVEEAGRNVRYDLFEKLAREHGYTKIALGHHRDDRVETVLFRLLRGTGPAGLAGMPVKRGKIIRPLYDVSKEDILAYLKERGLKYCHDQSNRQSDYSRNFIRLKLLPAIRDKLNSGVDKALINLSEIAADEERFLESRVKEAFIKAVGRTPGGKIRLDLKRFSGYAIWLQRRLLRRCLTSFSLDETGPDRAVVERVLELCKAGRKSVSLPGRLQAAASDTELILYRRQSSKFLAELVPGQKCRLEWPRVELSASVTNSVEPVKTVKLSSTVAVDFKKVVWPLTVRNIRPGDRFLPLGMKGSKKVGNYLTDRKVPTALRDEVLVVTDRKGIIWLVGYEIAHRVKIDSQTRKVLKIAVRQRG